MAHSPGAVLVRNWVVIHINGRSVTRSATSVDAAMPEPP